MAASCATRTCTWNAWPSAAAHFAYPWDGQRRPQRPGPTGPEQHPHGLWRCRLQLHANGQVEAQAFACPPAPAHITLQWASAASAQAHSEFVRFKTTRRAHYEALAPAADSGVFDSGAL